MPLVLGPDKKRLSKRHAATSLEEYKLEGYLDSAILNTLARLGWSRGDKEVFYMEDLIRDFKITEMYRFEGDSSPDDNSVLYAIESKDGIKGVLVDAYGTYAEAMSPEMAMKLKQKY